MMGYGRLTRGIETSARPTRSERAREEADVAGSKRPSFLKREKEQRRLARAVAKREARRARKQAKAAQVAGSELPEPALEPTDGGDPAEP